MQPITDLPPKVAGSLIILFCDIDDTLTYRGKLPAKAYSALWDLTASGISVVPVTGRPAGWCDLIARQWPVAGVVGENGALAFWEHNGRLNRMFHPTVVTPDEVYEKLDAVRRDVIAEVPGSRVAHDQAYRLFDLAIDVCEEPPNLGPDAADRIRAIFERHGARARVSSIHVNGWFGDYDKLAMVRLFARDVLGLDLDNARDSATFCGDSPNDEPLFAYFPHACGVANVVRFADKMAHLPNYVSSGEGGKGFAEIVAEILGKRSRDNDVGR